VISDLLEQNAASRANKPFVVTEEGDCSYAAMYSASRRFASRLAVLGLAPGDHVALIASNSAAFLACWFGIAMVGAVAVTLSDELVGDGLDYSVTQSDSKLLVVDASWLASRGGRLSGALSVVPVETLPEDAAFFAGLAGLPEAVPVKVPASAACTILYTSGSTGLPKGVLNSHGAYEAAGRQTVNTVGMVEDDRILVFLPLFHANPQMFAVMSVLSVGATLVVIKKFSASSFFDQAIRFKATCFTFVGTVLSILVARHTGERKDHSLRFAVGGGTPGEVWRAIDRRFGIRVHEGYGMTEIGCFVVCNTVADYRRDTCGKSRPDMHVSIVDAEDRELPPGTQGEIVVRPRAPNVIMLGYYKKPELTLRASSNFWFHTGDRGSLDADGYLTFHGRLKELIRKGGEMISPVEIETKLRAMPGVTDCAVVGVADEVQGQEVKAIVVCSAPGDGGAVVSYLTGKIPRFMLPRYVEFLDAIPKTETQKIQRFKLQYIDRSVIDLKQ
jgi:acyl-CoA synthetase (AMP-forming)/AMP-acid ligase II